MLQLRLPNLPEFSAKLYELVLSNNVDGISTRTIVGQYQMDESRIGITLAGLEAMGLVYRVPICRIGNVVNGTKRHRNLQIVRHFAIEGDYAVDVPRMLSFLSSELTETYRALLEKPAQSVTELAKLKKPGQSFT